MKILFDNNLSPHLAHAVRELSKVEPAISEVIHLCDRFARNTPDVEWIGSLTAPWVIISIDSFSKNHNAERAALDRAGHMVFVLDRQWSEQRFWQMSERLVRWWPAIVAQARRGTTGAFRVPWRPHSMKSFARLRA